MAEQAIATISNNRKNDSRCWMGGLRFSTASPQGLIQAYIAAGEDFPILCPNPDRVWEALKDPARKARAIFLLQKGALILSAIDCLDEGTPEAMEYLRVLLASLAVSFYKEAERA